MMAPRKRVVPQLQEYPSGEMMWDLIPSTDSTGVISSVKVVKFQSPRAIGAGTADQCQVVGRVVQISKRQNLILLKVTRPDEKTLKLTMSHPDPRMEISQLWSCTAIRVGSTLQITDASSLSALI